MRDALAYPIILSERISFLYFERCAIDRDAHSVVSIQGQDTTVIPVARTSVVMLGPGSNVSHAAIALLALGECLILWCGEAGVRMYACGNPRSTAEPLVRQAALFADPHRRLDAGRVLYTTMFDEPAPERRSIDQLRGMEGFRVKHIFRGLAARHGLEWMGRTHSMSDPVNLAVSTATAALYGLAEAVILSLGYSPAIGFVHSGDPRSFVFDLADTVKFKTVVPAAFEQAALGAEDLEGRVRRRCRDIFYKEKLVDQMIATMEAYFRWRSSLLNSPVRRRS